MGFAQQLLNENDNGSRRNRSYLSESDDLYLDDFDDDFSIDEDACCLGCRKIMKPTKSGLANSMIAERDFIRSDSGLMRQIDASINHTFPLDDDDDDI